MAKDRPTLTSLSDRLARKPISAERDAKTEEGDVGQTNTHEASAKKIDVRIRRSSIPTKAKAVDDRVQIIVRMSPAERKSLRQIALDQDTTVQALAEEAIRDILRQQVSKRSTVSSSRR